MTPAKEWDSIYVRTLLRLYSRNSSASCLAVASGLETSDAGIAFRMSMMA